MDPISYMYIGKERRKTLGKMEDIYTNCSKKAFKKRYNDKPSFSNVHANGRAPTRTHAGTRATKHVRMYKHASGR